MAGLIKMVGEFNHRSIRVSGRCVVRHSIVCYCSACPAASNALQQVLSTIKCDKGSVLRGADRIVPKNLHLKKMNPNIDLTDFPVIMPSSIIDWKGSRAVAGTSSFGFSGTNSHGTLEAPAGGEGKNVILERPEKLKWNRTYHRMYHEWSQGLWFASEWRPAPLAGPKSQVLPCLVVGGGAFAEAFRELVGAEHCELQPAKADGMAAALKSKGWKAVVFAETLVADDPTAEGPAMAALLSAAQAAAGLGALRFSVVTVGAQEATTSEEGIGCGLLGAAAWGFMRSMPLEAPQLHAQVIDLTGP